MNRSILLAAALALTPAVALAQAEQKDPGSLSNKAMKDNPGATGAGSTAAPTAKPGSGDLPAKVTKDNPGTDGGSTGEPTAQPKTNDLPAAQKDDMGK
jgi:hypothetical protein